MSDIRFNQWLHQSGTGGVSQVANGAVGVGTTNPLADFYVRGDAQITGILTAGHIAMGSSITFGDDDRAILEMERISRYIIQEAIVSYKILELVIYS